MEDAYEYTQEELAKLGDIIVWTAILAAVHADGVIKPSEKAEAVKQTHIRTFSTQDYLKPIYKYLDTHFEQKFDTYTGELPEGMEEKENHIRQKLGEALGILPELGPMFAGQFSKDVRDFYNRVFRADSNVFQYFAFPVISAHLQKLGLK